MALSVKVRAKMTAVKRQKLGNSTGQYQVNFADGILQALNLLQTDDFVKSVVSNKGTPPTIILYLTSQIEYIRQLCCDRPNGSILTFDTTFNMTKGLYVTTSVFKHAFLLSRRTGEEPIFMGPLCLHGSLSTETYGTFMDHLARVLHRGGTDQLVIGSDNDAALRSAIRQAFPNSPLVLCTRHVQDNVERHLRQEIPDAPDKQRRDILHLLFGTTGLSRLSDASSFDHKVCCVNQY